MCFFDFINLHISLFKYQHIKGVEIIYGYFFLHFPSEEGGEIEIVKYAMEKFKKFEQ